MGFKNSLAINHYSVYYSTVQNETFENYPWRIIVIANIVTFGIYISGAVILYQYGIVWMTLYLAYILAFEIRLLQKSCVNCYYFGKYCAFGRGKISSLFFAKGNPEEFCKKKVTWKDLLPDLLVGLIPVVAGSVLLVLNFSWLILLLIGCILAFATAGNNYVRGSLACKFCKQGRICCPANRFFTG